MSGRTIVITCLYVSHSAAGYFGLIYMMVVAEFKEKANPSVEALSSFTHYFPNDSLDKASHVGKTKFREWEKYILPLARRGCKIDQLSIQIWEEFLSIVIIVVLKSTTFYFIAIHY